MTHGAFPRLPRQRHRRCLFPASTTKPERSRPLKNIPMTSSASPVTQGNTCSPLFVKDLMEKRVMPPQMTTSTPRWQIQLIRARELISPMENLSRLVISVPSTVTSIMAGAQSKRGDTRNPKRGTAMVMADLHISCRQGTCQRPAFATIFNNARYDNTLKAHCAPNNEPELTYTYCNNAI